MRPTVREESKQAMDWLVGEWQWPAAVLVCGVCDAGADAGLVARRRAGDDAGGAAVAALHGAPVRRALTAIASACT